MRNHIIPRVYYKAFTNDSNQKMTNLFILKDNTIQERIGIKDVAVEKRYFLYKNTDGTYNAEIEDQLAKYENNEITPIISKIQKKTSLLTLPEHIAFDDKDKNSIINMIVNFQTRAKDFREYSIKATDTLFPEFLNELVRSDKTGQIKIEINNQIMKDKERFLDESIKRTALIEKHDSLQQYLLSSRYCLFYRNYTALPYITSDEPIIYVNSLNNQHGVTKTALKDPFTVIYFPVTPHIMIALYSAALMSFRKEYDNRLFDLSESDYTFIHYMNCLQLKTAHSCVISNNVDILHFYQKIKMDMV